MQFVHLSTGAIIEELPPRRLGELPAVLLETARWAPPPRARRVLPPAR
ncbi:MAG: hypothetical protein ACLF0G_03230 [Candidatus Brocadiia bacterium]